MQKTKQDDIDQKIKDTAWYIINEIEGEYFGEELLYGQWLRIKEHLEKRFNLT